MASTQPRDSAPVLRQDVIVEGTQVPQQGGRGLGGGEMRGIGLHEPAAGDALRGAPHQLRRAHGVQSVAPTEGRFPWLRSVLVLPTDYGVLCWTFLLLGAPLVFLWVYAVITACTLAFLALALVKWFREVRAL